MNNKTQIEEVDNLVENIFDKLQDLMQQKVISAKDYLQIFNILNDREYEWLQSKFSPEEIRDFI